MRLVLKSGQVRVNSAPVRNLLFTVSGQAPVDLEIICVGQPIRIAVLPFSLESFPSGIKRSLIRALSRVLLPVPFFVTECSRPEPLLIVC